ncbi:Fmp27_GFWDK domain-containing protein/Apt1 domain-containing protein [Cephalotus follicularis]|uniref:Fmp27_GFWDK domain-containing protein/Apt1 domain-containing protein n=1 Tax=Cephalotus follicularis TaxID=3775 RepID=A0A1Q3BFP4_CEPFO|nr:Fmp27_GFWDK domain-containing protein/Apt1 domain-containing protein [Cephalotus follicularis]
MAASPVKFLFGFLIISITLWILFIFASRLLAWILSRKVGASVGFRVGGWKCLKDVVVKFNKGAVESVSVGEIKLSLRQSLVKLGVGFISKDPKLQVLICDLEVVMRPSNKSLQRAKTRKPRTSGRGKWMVVANIARFLSFSVTDMVVKMPIATVEVKELKVDISKDGGSKPNLFVKLQILPIIVHMGEPRVSCDQSSNLNSGGCISASQSSFAMMERSSAFLNCEEFSLFCEFVHEREAGVVIQNLDINFGEVTVNLNEELLSKKQSSSYMISHTDKIMETTIDSVAAKKPHKKQAAVLSLTKYASMFPEKVCCNIPKLDVRFMHREHGIAVENNIMGIQLKSMKSRCTEDVGESTRLDVQMDFSEIHLLREAGSSVLEIMKVDVVSFVYIPIQSSSLIRAEVDVKLGGTQCNIIISRLKPWLCLHFSKKKRMVLREESSTLEKPQSKEFKAIMWTCTVSAPEMTIVLYSISGLPLYHGCSQSSHVFANNVSSMGTAVHMELGEINLHMADEYQECLKESLFGVESNSGSLMHIAKFSLDWGKKDMESSEDGPRCNLVLSVDVTGMGVCFTFKRVESLIVTAMSFQALLKSLSTSGKRTTQSRGGHSSKSSGKGTRLLKFNLERCSVNFWGEAGLENSVVADPKRVNYGSQGGRVVINASADGTPRTAHVMSTVSDGCQKLKYSVSLDIFHFSLCVNKEKQSTQIELERARSMYQEYLEEHRPSTRIVLFDMQNAKFVRRSGGLKEIAVCSLFSATDITVRWEPDAHLSLVELILQLKSLIHNQKLQNQKLQGHGKDVSSGTDAEQKDETVEESDHSDKHKKKETIFAVDVEMLSIFAVVGDGVDAMVRVQSIFSENARIGVLLEGLMLSFNGSRVLKSSRMQISRIPSASVSSSDAKVALGTTWDWVIQGIDVHICMPYRLELRAIDDSVEDMLRALKIVIAAKTNLLYPTKQESSKPKKPTSMKFGCLKFCIRKLTADIEEEPMQGWLDEHYQLMKKEACELAVRLKFVDEFISKSSQFPKSAEANDSTHEKKINYDGIEIDAQDPSAIQKMKEEIYKKSFRSYYQACQKLVPSEGSGVCAEGFQAGFKSSTARTSLLSITATDLNLSLTRIDGGDAGMIEVLRKLDPVCAENNIPFSRLYGSNIILSTGNLAVQLRNYTFPLFCATSGKCEGRIVLAQQATSFQPQVHQDVFIGRWRKVCMLRSASGTTPPVKTYSDLPIYFQKAEVSFGVGYEPVFADVSYAFTVALRRANLSVRNPGPLILPPKKERSLPWWDDMRNYIHGNISLFFSESRWHILATTDPYEKFDELQVISGSMEIQQSDGRVYVAAQDFKILLSSLDENSRNLKLPTGVSGAFLEAPVFTLEVTMHWECDSGNPMNHYLFALPIEGSPREKVFDPFRSTSLSLRWNFSLRPSASSSEKQFPSASVGDGTIGGSVYGPPFKPDNGSIALPTMNVGAHDLAWVIKFWNMNYLPPHKLRTFSRWPRFGVPRVPRSGNLSLDKVMTEFMLRIDATPTCIKHMPLDNDDPAKGLMFDMTKLKYEICYSRGKQKYTFECKRDPLDLVYQGLDLHMPKAFVNKEDSTSVAKVVQATRKNSQSLSTDKISSENDNCINSCTEKHRDDGFLLSSDYFTIRRQARKADPERLLAWQQAGRRNLEMTYVRSEFENGSESDEHTRSDPSDDDGYSVLIADNCQRVFVYGLKLLWTLTNRDAVWSWVGGISKAFEPPKPSPSRQYAQRKLIEENQRHEGADTSQDDISKIPSSSHCVNSPSNQAEAAVSLSSPSHSVKMENSSSEIVRNDNANDSEEDGALHFMVNVIEPQFNLHSEEANGRFLLAAVSGHVLARSFHSVLHVGYEMIEQALGTGNVQIPECGPEMTWTRMEFSVMLKHVQAHVAPTDVDPGAGLQWLPKILRSSPKVKRTGALLERVFMPCDMYFRYTRHKGGTPDLKVKPLKELTFNSDNITATMTSRQFQVMLDVLTNLLFARLPKPRKSSLSYPSEDDEDVEEEADEVVPDGVEEVEIAKIDLEQKEREQKLIHDDIRKLSLYSDTPGDQYLEKEGDLWMITGGRSLLVQGLKRELVKAQKSRKVASTSLRMALQKAAQLRLMEKDKNKSPSYAMRISLQINKVVWSMLVDGKSFAEAEINDMIYDFDRDYKDVGVAQFTTKYFVVRNCLPNAKSDMLLSAWNPPPEWGKKVMLRVDAKQGAPKDGNSPLELFQVEIYPLKIHLTETMYRMMWEYFFPEEEQDSQRRQEVWKVSTNAGARRVKKGLSIHEASTSSSHATKESDISTKTSVSTLPSTSVTNASSVQASKLQSLKTNITGSSNPELRRTSSFDRTWEETVAESIANELVLQAHSSSVSSSKCGQVGSTELQDDSTKNKLKDLKPIKSGRSSHEEKKVAKSHEEKRSRPRKMMEFHSIKISQVELLVTYEGSRFVVNDLKLLMDTFNRVEFTGTWRRLFSRVKKHIIWGVLKSVTGMQGKKFKDKVHSQGESSGAGVLDSDLNLSDNDATGIADQYPITFLKRQSDGAGDGFVTSIRGLFYTQRHKAKAFVRRAMRGESETDFQAEWSEGDADISPFARQRTINQAKRLLRKHTNKFRSRGQKGSSSQQRESLPSSPRESNPFESDSSSGSSPFEDFHE